MLRGFHACPVKWVSRKNYCFLNTTGSKLFLGEQIHFLEPASNVWKNRRKVTHYNAWFSQLTGNTPSWWGGKRNMSLNNQRLLYSLELGKDRSHGFCEGAELAPACWRQLPFLPVCHKGCNIPLYPKYHLPPSMNTTLWMSFSSKTKMRRKASRNIFRGEKLECTKCCYVSRVLAFNKATTKFKRKGKKVLLKKKSDTKQCHEI